MPSSYGQALSYAERKRRKSLQYENPGFFESLAYGLSTGLATGVATGLTEEIVGRGIFDPIDKRRTNKIASFAQDQEQQLMTRGNKEFNEEYGMYKKAADTARKENTSWEKAYAELDFLRKDSEEHLRRSAAANNQNLNSFKNTDIDRMTYPARLAYAESISEEAKKVLSLGKNIRTDDEWKAFQALNNPYNKGLVSNVKNFLSGHLGSKDVVQRATEMMQSDDRYKNNIEARVALKELRANGNKEKFLEKIAKIDITAAPTSLAETRVIARSWKAHAGKYALIEEVTVTNNVTGQVETLTPKILESVSSITTEKYLGTVASPLSIIETMGISDSAKTGLYAELREIIATDRRSNLQVRYDLSNPDSHDDSSGLRGYQEAMSIIMKWGQNPSSYHDYNKLKADNLMKVTTSLIENTDYISQIEGWNARRPVHKTTGRPLPDDHPRVVKWANRTQEANKVRAAILSAAMPANNLLEGIEMGMVDSTIVVEQIETSPGKYTNVSRMTPIPVGFTMQNIEVTNAKTGEKEIQLRPAAPKGMSLEVQRRHIENYNRFLDNNIYGQVGDISRREPPRQVREATVEEATVKKATVEGVTPDAEGVTVEEVTPDAKRATGEKVPDTFIPAFKGILPEIEPPSITSQAFPTRRQDNVDVNKAFRSLAKTYHSLDLTVDPIKSTATTRLGKAAEDVSDASIQQLSNVLAKGYNIFLKQYVDLSVPLITELKKEVTTLWKWANEENYNEDVGSLLRMNQISTIAELKAERPEYKDDIDNAAKRILIEMPTIKQDKLKQGIANLVFGDPKYSLLSRRQLKTGERGTSSRFR